MIVKGGFIRLQSQRKSLVKSRILIGKCYRDLLAPNIVAEYSHSISPYDVKVVSLQWIVIVVYNIPSIVLVQTTDIILVCYLVYC